MPNKKKRLSGKWIVLIIALIIIGAIITLSSLTKDSKITAGDKVAVIYINGPIAANSGLSILGEESASSTEIIRFIDSADKDPGIKAIMIEINSPGGTAVASKEIADRLKRSEKYKVALIREAGTSGAYWTASACDKIIANDLSIVGSIGVIGSYFEFSGLLDRYNVTYQRLVSGQYKDIGSPFKKMTGDEEQKLQSQIDSMHRYFTAEIASNRNMDLEKASDLATGEFYIGFDALNLGLVDVLGDRFTAEAVLKEKLNTTKISFIDYKRKSSILDAFTRIISEQSFFVGKGLGSSIFDLRQQNFDIRI